VSVDAVVWRDAAVIDPARFEAFREGALRGWLARGLDPQLRERLRRDPDGLLATGVVLKDDAASTVVALAEHACVLKRFRFPDAWRALRRAPRTSRALLAFRAALRLEALGFGVAAPLGVVDARTCGLGTASWLLTIGLPGRDAGALLADPTLDDAARARLVEALVEVVRRLQRCRVVHGDLKASNFLVDERSVRLLDLHAVGRVRRADHVGLRRDRRRFLRNFEAWPVLRARARALLGG
jgi:tRNA A-37 threonylcarbamoyl transferase component Bud32